MRRCSLCISNFNELRKRGHRKVIHRMGGAFSLTNRYFVPIGLLYRVLGKNYVFHNPLQTIPRLHMVARDLLSLTQCEYTVTLICVLFSVKPTIVAQCWRKCRILTNIFKKYNISGTPCSSHDYLSLSLFSISLSLSYTAGI